MDSQNKQSEDSQKVPVEDSEKVSVEENKNKAPEDIKKDSEKVSVEENKNKAPEDIKKDSEKISVEENKNKPPENSQKDSEKKNLEDSSKEPPPANFSKEKVPPVDSSKQNNSANQPVNEPKIEEKKSNMLSFDIIKPVVVNPAGKSNPLKKSPLKIFLIVLIVILILGLIAGGVVLGLIFFKKKSDEPEPIPTIYDYKYTETEGFLGNPLKGFAMSVETSKSTIIPSSLEYLNLLLSDIYPKEDEINLDYLENQLAEVANRKRQLIIRLVLDDPEKNGATPDWLFDKAKSCDYLYSGSVKHFIDYNDEFVLSILEGLFKQIGKKFDGDPRIAFWQLGTYGHLGEWDLLYANEEDKANDKTLDRIMDMALNNFKKTMVQVAKPEVRSKIRNIGFFHNKFGSFEFDEIMENYLDSTGTSERWVSQSFGGELYDGIQTEVFGDNYYVDKFNLDIITFHPTYIYDDYFFINYQSLIDKYEDWLQNRVDAENLMGYNYYLTNGEVKIFNYGDKNNVEFNLNVTNKGIAPFYYEWNVNFGIIQISIKNEVTVLREDKSNSNIYGVLPGEIKTLNYKMKGINSALNDCYFAFRIPSGVGTYVKLSNAEQRDDGWFVISKIISE